MATPNLTSLVVCYVVSDIHHRSFWSSTGTTKRPTTTRSIDNMARFEQPPLGFVRDFPEFKLVFWVIVLIKISYSSVRFWKNIKTLKSVRPRNFVRTASYESIWNESRISVFTWFSKSLSMAFCLEQLF